MSINADSKLIEDVRPTDIAEFLRLRGWQELQSEHKNWLIFIGDHDDSGEPFEIVLPKRVARTPEARMHLASSLNLLSELNGEDVTQTLERVQYRNWDVLRIRALDDEIDSAISLDVAAQQVQAMRQLVGYGACSEKKALPFYGQLNKDAKRIVDSYGFGHTFRGSFGFTLTSPVRSVERYTQSSLFDDEDTASIVVAPTERRVMERIVRGLSSTKEAVQQHKPEQIARQYQSAFNANMCQSIVKLSYRKTIPTEFEVLWSPKLRPSDDVEHAPAVHLNKVEYASLETAEATLRETQPELIFVRGRITELRSSDNPRGLDSRRTVVIHWIHKNIPGPAKVLVELSPDQYREALRAHEDWISVEVSGYLQRLGYYWRLNEPRDFRLV